MFRRPIKEINAEYAANEQYLDSIRQIVKDACITAGMSQKNTSGVLLAVEEGATNIIRHAYLYEKGSIRLRIVIYKKLVAFSLIDTGRSFQPNARGKIDLEQLVESARKGGLGFYMMQKIMDSVEYISAAGYNELRMLKRVRAESTGAPFLRRLFTLRVKFSFWTFFIVALIVGGSFIYVNDRSTKEIYSHLNDTVVALAKTIADQAAGHIINRRSDVEFDELMVSYTRANPMLVQVVLTDTSSMTLAHSDDIALIRRPYTPPVPGNVQPGAPVPLSSKGEHRFYLTVPIKSGERLLGEVHVTYTSDNVLDKLTEARERALFLTVGLMLVGIIGVYLLSNYFVKPIAKITTRVRRFSSGDLETELPLEGADEFFEISRALNDMTTRLRRDRQNIIAREKMAKEIEVASQIQRTLLPTQLPKVPGLEIDACYRAASMVGGDLYDVFPTRSGRYCLVVADVSGKGVPASLVMSMLRTVIQIHAEDAVSAKTTLVSVHEYLSKNIPSGMFITVQLGIFDPHIRQLSFVSAGHNPLLFLQCTPVEVMRVNPAGMPLGVPDTLGEGFVDRLEETTLDFQPGDCVLMYTDGITEATDRGGRQFGMDRLVEFLTERMASETACRDVRELSEAIVSEVDNFSGFTSQNDDITFIVARCSERDSAPEAAGEEDEEEQIGRVELPDEGPEST